MSVRRISGDVDKSADFRIIARLRDDGTTLRVTHENNRAILQCDNALGGGDDQLDASAKPPCTRMTQPRDFTPIPATKSVTRSTPAPN